MEYRWRRLALASLINNINGRPLHSLTHIFPILVFPGTSHEIFSQTLLKLILRNDPKILLGIITNEPILVLPESFNFMQFQYGSICENAT